ncbi:hypothetical protein SAMN05216366_11728 [Selenomonas ruminantium]|uniref:Sce7725 family protein n=2 Tax=Selenomonas ruminantium TaxID=971 RepID=A0A1H0SE26_SELRU|nr:hypothetical protein SAMN05216366_11728 [Selenomonas ruminantium]
MYFPYFRGRQYDLLALKELAQKRLISNEILPVVEPVKISATLDRTLKCYVDAKMRLAMVLNPEVKKLGEEENMKLYDKTNEFVLPAIIMNNNAPHVIDQLRNKGYGRNDILVILNNRDEVEKYKKIFKNDAPAYVLIPDERSIKRAVSNNKILLEDKFHKLNRNADYANNDDEFFSDDHRYYKEEGYIGFADYSMIGENYDESGFAPRAVAIHIVYIDKDMNFRIHHFVSNSNHGLEDVAGKYYEAVMKLKAWYRSGNEKQRTVALSTFLEHAEKGYFPGLPTIKKLSIMHHLELVDRVLRKESDK